MYRPIKTVLIVAIAGVAGGCAGKAVHMATQPALTPVVAVAPSQPMIDIDVLPVRELHLEELMATSAHAEEAVVPVKSPCDVVEQIARIRPQLASTSLAVSSKKYSYTEIRGGKKTTFHEPEQQIALALLNSDTCTPRIVTITQQGKRLIAPSGYDIEAVRRVNGIQWNGRSTEYHVNQPEGLYVIAVAFPSEQEKKIPEVLKAASGRLFLKTKKVKTVTNQLYTPYSRELDAPAVIAVSLQYQKTIMQRIDDRLRASSVRSLANPTQPVVDVKALRPEYVTRKVLIEHMDLGEFLLGPAETTRRVNVVFGMNPDQFASHVCSSEKACGAAQFIKGTWKTMVQNYPTVGLAKDFVAGARNMFDALTAARLLDDYHLAEARKSLSSSEYERLLADAKLTEEFLAVAYNGGPGRAVPLFRAYVAHADRYADWMDALPTCKRKRQKSCIPAETKGYIAKLRYTRDEWPDDMIAWANQTSD